MVTAIVKKLNGDSTSNKQAPREFVLFMLYLLDKLCCIESYEGNHEAVRLKEVTKTCIRNFLKQWVWKPKVIGGTMFGVGGKFEAEIDVGSIRHHH